MAYSEEADWNARIGAKMVAQCSNDTANSETADATVLTALVTAVDALIDGKLSQVYDVPLESTPDIVNDISADLVCVKLLQRRFSEMGLSPDWQQRGKDAMQNLQEIADLKIALPDTISVSSAEADIVAPDKVIDFNDEDRQESFF